MIISLSGKKRSGKSSVAKHLVEVHNYIEVSWAEPLKEIVGRQLFGLTDEQLYGDTLNREENIEEWSMSARQILQVVGTDMFRKHICDDFWVRAGMKVLRGHLAAGHTDLVISDTRFPNECDAAEKLGGVTVHISRVGGKGLEVADTHPSETALDNWMYDYKIAAEFGQLPELYKQIDEIVRG